MIRFAAKVSGEFSKENEKLVVLGGVLFGTELLDAGWRQGLAKLPSLDELRGKFVGMLNTPATQDCWCASSTRRSGGPSDRTLMRRAIRPLGPSFLSRPLL